MSPFLPDELTLHADALRRIARELVGGDGPWEDLVQGTYLAALERPPRKLSYSWLRRVLFNRAHDLYRRGGATREQSRESVEPNTIATGPDGAEIAQRLDLHHELVAAVRALREPHRQVVFLRYFEDLPPTRIAERLEIPLKTVKTGLHRALEELRRRLDARYGSGARSWMAAIVPLAFPRDGAASVVLGTGARVGVGIMMKKVALGVLVAAGLVGIYRLRSGGADARTEAPVGAAHSADVASPVPATVDTELPGAVPRARERLEPTAEPTKSPAPTVGTLLVHVLEHDRESAHAGVWIGLVESTRSQPSRGVGFERTDRDGIARFAQLEQGRFYAFSSGMGDGAFAEVVVGEERTVELVLPEMLDVGVVVVDQDESPVAGAEIWLSTGRGDWMGGRKVATSDADGVVFLERIPRGESLGAVADGFTPSELVDLDLVDFSDPPAEVLLILGAGGSGLRGVVLDPVGEPVPDALVAIGSATEPRLRMSGQSLEEGWTPRTATTDETGAFAVAGLAPGATKIAVRADGFPVWKTSVEIPAGAWSDVEVTLADAASLEGIVRDSNNEPVGGVIVRAFQDTGLGEFAESFVHLGQFDYTGTFAYPSTVTDEDGRYALTVPPGALIGFANLPRARDVPGAESRLSFGMAQPYARDVLEALPCERVAWNPVLSFGRSITGRVTFKSGAPLDDVFVSARNQETNEHMSVGTDADGTFRFIKLADAPHTIRVQFWPRLDRESLAEPLSVRDVRPGGPDVLLVASIDEPAAVEPGVVIGRVDDRSGRVRTVLGVQMTTEDGRMIYSGDVVGDEFRFDQLAPGWYRLVVLSGEDVVHVGEPFDVSPGAEIDLGTVATGPAGAAEVRIVRSLGTEDVDVRLGLELDGAHRGLLSLGTESELSLDNLCPGAYLAHVYAAGVATLTVPFDVTAGETADVEFEIRAAVRCPIEVWYPGDQTLVSVVISAEDGSLYAEWTSPRALEDRPWVKSPDLPLGRFMITVATSGGLTGHATLDVRSLDLVENALRIDVE